MTKNSFDIGAPFHTGVAYLSRAEEAFAQEQNIQFLNRGKTVPDITIAPDDAQALDFFRRARHSITTWIESTAEDKRDFVNIGTGSNTGSLNGYQRRLVHQLVRNKFPTLRTFAKLDGAFMQVVKIDEEREALHTKRRMQAFTDSICRQIGLRWVFDALCGLDLSAIDAKLLCLNEIGKPTFHDLEEKRAELADIRTALGGKSKVLVGHNLFTDLIFLYQTFIGRLPETVIEFGHEIHRLFPMIVDTKYMGSEEGGTMGAVTSLDLMLGAVKKQIAPFIVLAEGHSSYATQGVCHQAGYDSQCILTCRIALG